MFRAIFTDKVTILLIILGVFAYFVFAEVEFFEAVYRFSRSHESWELDELIALYFVASLAFPVLLVRWNISLRRANEKIRLSEAKAQYLARHDPLTGLGNRRFFYELLDGLAAECETDPTGRALKLIIIDLDDFKPINDRWGHKIGDDVLVQVADRLKETFADARGVVRLGGDEFAVAFCGEKLTVEEAAERAIAAMEDAFCGEGWRAEISCSIGIAHWGEGKATTDLLHDADQAMYAAKRRGGRCFAGADPAALVAPA